MLLTCGVNRLPNPWDKENLLILKSWNFSEDMILEAAKISAGKSSPTAYMNGVLSNWKNKGVFSIESASENSDPSALTQEEYNREYARRRTVAVAKAQKNLEKAQELPDFSKVYERLFGIEKDLAFAEIAENSDAMEKLNAEKAELNERAKTLLSAIGLTMSDLSPKYACDKCNDTGYVGTHRCDCFNKKVD